MLKSKEIDVGKSLEKAGIGEDVELEINVKVKKDMISSLDFNKKLVEH